MEVKNKKKVLSGFGHRVYKNYDPRAKIVKKVLLYFITLRSLLMSLKSVERSHWLRLPWNWKRSLLKTSTSLPESYIPTSTSTVDWFTEPWVSQQTCTQSYSPFLEWQDGSLTGPNFWMTLKTISTGPEKTMLATARDNLQRCQREEITTLISTLLDQRKIREEKLPKNLHDSIRLICISLIYL